MKEKFIAGIYNYCDRWCERCSFTRRCRTYKAPENRSGKSDQDKEDFWKEISDNMGKAIELLHKMAAESGINLDDISEEESKEILERDAAIEKAAKNHVLSGLCRKYRHVVMPFFKNQIDGELVSRTEQLVSHLHMGMNSEENVVHTMAGLGECEEVIRWYVFFIDAKLQRALQGKLEDMDDEEAEEIQTDSNGSAKIAIIAIERSIGAWIKMYELLPSCEDTALNALSILHQLKREATAEFPQALNFRRPGFDD